MEPSGRPPDVNKQPNFLDFDDLKAIKIPKTRHEKGSSVLEKVDLNSFMFSDEILKIIEKSFLRLDSKKNFEYKGAQFVNNRFKMNEFNNRRKELKMSGYSERELKEEYGFMIHPDNSEKCHELSVHGIKVGNYKKNILGSSSQGVLLSRHADLVTNYHLESGDIFDLFIFKYIKGRIKTIDPSENEIDPTFNFDSHVMKGGEALKQKLTQLTISQAFNFAQIFLYEYDETAEIVESPRHICPFAIVSVKLHNRYRLFKEVKSMRRSVDLGESSVKIQHYSVPPKRQLNYNPNRPSTSSSFCLGTKETASFNQSYPKPQTARPSENESRIVWKGHLSTNKNRILCECVLVSNNPFLVPIEISNIIYLQNRIELHDVEEKHFGGVTAINFMKESLNSQNGYINAFKLKQADGCSKILSGISNYFSNTHSAGLADLPNGYRILVFPHCQLTEKLGLPSENGSTDVFIITISRASLQLPQRASIFAAPKMGARIEEQDILGKIDKQKKVQMSRKYTRTYIDPDETHWNVTSQASTNIRRVEGEPTGGMNVITNTEYIGPARDKDVQDRDRSHMTDHVKNWNRKDYHGGNRNHRHRPEKRKSPTDTQHPKIINERVSQTGNETEIPSKQKRNDTNKESQTEFKMHHKSSKNSKKECVTSGEIPSKSHTIHTVKKSLTYHYYMSDFPRPSGKIMRSKNNFPCVFDYYVELKKKFVNDLQFYLEAHPSLHGTPSSSSYSSLKFSSLSSSTNKDTISSTETKENESPAVVDNKSETKENESPEGIENKSETKATKSHRSRESKHSSKKSEKPKSQKATPVEIIPPKEINQIRRVELKSNGKKFINPNYDEFSDSAPIKSYAFVPYDYDKSSLKSNWIIGGDDELVRPVEEINCMKNLMDFTVTIQGLSGRNKKKLEKSGTGRVAMTYLVLHGQVSISEETKNEETLIESLWMEGLHSLLPKSHRKISDKKDSQQDKIIFHLKQLMIRSNGAFEVMQSFKKANDAPNDRVAAIEFLRSSYKKYVNPLEFDHEDISYVRSRKRY